MSIIKFWEHVSFLYWSSQHTVIRYKQLKSLSMDYTAATQKYTCWQP